MKIKYPSESFLIVRPCYKAMTWQCQASAKLLTALVYLSNPKNQDGEEDTNEIEVEGTIGDVRISCSQARLIELLVDEVSEKTLHDVATPFLQLLGFIDIENTPRGIEYILHLDYFLKALALYVPKQKSQPQLEKFLISHLQLEKFLIKWELEIVLNAIGKTSKCNKKNFQLLLEIILIQNRNSSNSQRGRKSRQEVDLEALLQTPKNLIEESKILKERKEGVAALASHPSPSFSETHSQLPIASRHYETSTAEDVTQVSQESEIAHGYAVTVTPHLPGDDYRRTVGTQHPLSAGASIPLATGRKEPGIESHGYEKGVGDESSTGGIWDRDAGGAGRDTALPPAPDQHFARDPQEQAVQETQAAQVTQQIPLSQGLAPALDGDARERSAPSVATALLLSHTLQGTSLLGEMSLDALLSQPRGERTKIKTLLSQLRGQPTRMTQGEPIRAGDTSLSDITSQPTETVPMKPASPSKTVQGKENKKLRGTSETQPEILLESPLVEPDMHGIWNHEKVIQYTEWCLGERYRDTERTRQLNAAKAIHKDDFKLTLEDYKDAYDERNDEWWHEVKGQLHVSHMRGKEKDSGIDRLHAMLGKIAARKAKGSGKTSSSSSAPLGGMYKDKTAELAAERKKYLPPSSEAVTPRIVASATTFSYTR